MVFISEWRKEQAIFLQNSQLSVVVLPDHGGKVVSLYHCGNQFELLFQNPHPAFQTAAPGSDFSKFEACGFDDAFPTIDPCEISIGESTVSYPDHGEIWSSSFSYEFSRQGVRLLYNGKVLPYRYEKSLSLQENSLICDYKIENTGETEFPYLWAFHCLVNYKKEMRLIFPDGVTEIISAMDCRTLGKAGKKHLFNSSYLSPPKDPMSKYYISGRIRHGKCGYYYPNENMVVFIEFNPEALPYLGFWCTTGGYRGDKNCAFEPATGYYDNAWNAFQHKTGSTLRPYETFCFRISITLDAND